MVKDTKKCFLFTVKASILRFKWRLKEIAGISELFSNNLKYFKVYLKSFSAGHAEVRAGIGRSRRMRIVVCMISGLLLIGEMLLVVTGCGTCREERAGGRAGRHQRRRRRNRRQRRKTARRAAQDQNCVK